MIDINHYIKRSGELLSHRENDRPWDLTHNIAGIILEKIRRLGDGYAVTHGVAIHKTAYLDPRAVVKGPVIISPDCFVGPNAYLRGGVFLDECVTIGPGAEIKASFIFSHTRIAHFNFVGDSLVGSHVNMEAGAVIANHYNERNAKDIFVLVDGKPYPTGVHKFGALIGDGTSIGANAVLSPGTILMPESIVRRLQLVEQDINS